MIYSFCVTVHAAKNKCVMPNRCTHLAVVTSTCTVPEESFQTLLFRLHPSLRFYKETCWETRVRVKTQPPQKVTAQYFLIRRIRAAAASNSRVWCAFLPGKLLALCMRCRDSLGVSHSKQGFVCSRTSGTYFSGPSFNLLFKKMHHEM